MENLKSLESLVKHPAFISLIVLIVGIGLVIGLIRAIPEEQIESAPRVDRIYGNPDSKVVLEVYSDLECPACKVYWLNSEKQLLEKYGDKVRFEFKHFPLVSIHAKAKLAAEAAEAAGAQGKFLEYVGYLYEMQSSTETTKWGVEKFIEYAKAVGVEDIDRFERELRSRYYKKAIEEWIKLAEERGVDATPTIFVNGKKVENFTYENLAAEIDRALEMSQESTTTVTP